MTFNIILTLVWVYEVIYGIVKCARGEPIHPLIFTLTAAIVLVWCITRLI